MNAARIRREGVRTARLAKMKFVAKLKKIQAASSFIALYLEAGTGAVSRNENGRSIECRNDIFPD